ncbi:MULTISPECIES: twin-arginine translocation signal domain-containing protein [Natrialbaceae]|uniref:twin-arginine translocation signal domain-containing protein n=1 Tax=Natrialbaceae TaxID=1644061 RepID=UPI00207C1F69|nr:plastocyanin/azurin family copper-binding protein [Natronococcus sp. CG52]
MRETDPITRRNVLKIAGATGATALIAGCGGNGNGGEEPAEENGEEPAEGNETEDNETGGGGEALEPDTRIVLMAETQGWQGQEPEEIADEENPTITLQEGESYEIGWEEGDGSSHNIEIRDDSDEVVDDLSTEVSDEGGEDQFLEFDASSEMAAYVCEPHQDTMNGELQVESGEDGGEMNETEDNETEDNETEDNETEDNETEDNETEDNETDT